MKGLSMKNILTLVIMFAATLSLSSCGGTLDGAGRDISKMGDKISDTF